MRKYIDTWHGSDDFSEESDANSVTRDDPNQGWYFDDQPYGRKLRAGANTIDLRQFDEVAAEGEED